MKKQMKKLTLQTIVLMALTLGASAAHAQQAEPLGAPILTVFGDAAAGVSDGNLNSLGFNLERAYLGYQYKLNDNWKAKVVYDMGRGDDAALQRLGYVKNAEIDFSKGRWNVNMGLTSTAQFGVQEKFWGYRYVYKSMMDQYKWGSSADLGVMASCKAADWLSVDLSVMNGEGYKKVQADKQLQYGLGLTLKPVDGLTLRLFADAKTGQDTVSQCDVALFAGYKTKAFRVGAEYNMQMNHGNVEGRNLSGMSLYGAVRVSEHMEAYARYDRGTSTANDAWTDGQDGQMAMAGLHCSVNKLLAVSPNVRLWQPAVGKSTVFAAVSAKINL